MFISPLNLVMVEGNKQKEYKENFINNYSKILKELSYNPLTRREILKKTGIKISEQALIKNYLNPMIEKREIGSFKESDKYKGNREVLDEGYDKKLGVRDKLCYVYTPNSAKFYQDLRNTFSHLPNKEEYKKLVEDICLSFNMIEMTSKHQKAHFLKHKIVDKVLKKQNPILTSERINEKMKNAEIDMSNFAKKKIKINVPLSHLRKQVEGIDYLNIKDNLVEFDKLRRFLEIIRNNMDDSMFWISHRIKKNADIITVPMINKMVELFIKIEENSQIKI